MIDVMPQTRPISELRYKQAEIVDRLKDGPILLTRQGVGAAVLVDPEQWNQIVEQIEDLQLALDAVEARQAAEPVTDFEDYLVERGERVPAAIEQ